MALIAALAVTFSMPVSAAASIDFVSSTSAHNGGGTTSRTIPKPANRAEPLRPSE